jgi:CheY-like chemotaxis protein/pSer/pThr/pTyr-binding forkhead associated (FHA) protein
MPSLLISSSESHTRSYPLLEDVISIGRLPDNTIQISDPSVSSYHAKLILSGDRYLLKDLGSTNRSWVDGVPVSESEINHSCTIRFGSVECRFVLEGNGNGSPQPAPGLAAPAKQAPANTNSQPVASDPLVVSLTRQRDALIQTNHTLSTKLNELQKTIEAMRAESQIRREAACASENGSHADMEMTTLRKQRDAMQQVIDQLAPKLAEAEKRVAFLGAERNAALKANEELVARLAEMQRGMESHNAARETLHRRGEELNGLVNKQREQLLSLKDEFDAATQARDSGHEELARANKQLASLKREVEALKRQLADADAELSEAEEEEEEEPPPPKLRKRRVKKKIKPEPVEDEEDEEEDEKEEEEEEPLAPAKQPEPPKAKSPARTVREEGENDKPVSVRVEPTPAAPLPVTRVAPTLNSVPLQNGTPTEVSARIPAICGALKKMQTAHNYFTRHSGESHLLQEICEQAESVRGQSALTQLRPANELVSLLVQWLMDLQANPHLVNSQALRTSAHAIEVLDNVFGSNRWSRLKLLWPPCVLAVDDDRDVLDAVKGALESAYMKAVVANEARVGLEKLYTGKFDLVILDVGLPEVNGIELCSEIRSTPSHGATPILFVTGANTPETRAQTAISGGKDFIAKPFRITELALRSFLWVLKGQLEMV